MSDYLLYLDDSGTKEYSDDEEEYGVGPSRYFVFGGALLTQASSSRVSELIIRLKNSIFSDKAVEIKSNWLRIPHERQVRYLEPYGLSEDHLTEFVEEYYSIILNADLELLAGVVDKVHMLEDYGKPWYPPAIAYELVLQRVQNELENTSDIFRVTVDDMTGKTPRGTDYKKNLVRQHNRLKQRGSPLIDGYTFPNLRGRLKFVNSALSHLVQVADIAAYNVFRQFRDHGEDWEDIGIKQLPTYDYFNRMLHKFRQGPGGRIQGYGVVKFPMRRRIEWSVTED